MKVARVISRLNTGGPVTHVLCLAKELPQKGFECKLFAGLVGKDEQDMLPFVQQQGIKLTVIPELSREVSLLKDMRVLLKLWHELRKFRPDILHTHTAKAGALGRIVGLITRVPVLIHTFHGHVFHGYFGFVKTQLFLWVERILAFFTDSFVVLSPSQMKDLVETYHIAPEEKIRVIPLGCNISSYQYSAVPPEEKRKEWGLTSQHYLFGFIGRLVPIKNPSLFVQAIQVLMAQQIAKCNGSLIPQESVAAVLVGGGSLENLLKTRIKRDGHQSLIKLVGWQRDMVDIYSALDAVVLTSCNEGTPLVLIEAMAAGKPIVATNVGGVKDLMVGKGNFRKSAHGQHFVVYENGILVDSQDAGEICGALDFLLTNKEQGRQMGLVGRAFALEKFGLERLVRDIQKLYLELVNNKRMAQPLRQM